MNGAGRSGMERPVVGAGDPIPHDSISVLDGQSTVLQADTNRLDVICALQLFELQTRVCRIGSEETV